jgi:hypothetical protein
MTAMPKSATPRRETFVLSLPHGGSLQVEGWIPDRRYAQHVRVALPDDHALLIHGFRDGWFVQMEDDEATCAGGELTGCIASVLG